MKPTDGDRVAELEARLTLLEAALADGERPAKEPAVASEVSRRRLLYSGGAIAAGAAGALLAAPKPAGAQAPIAATDVTFAPAGQIMATDVQAALTEVDAEKAALAGTTFTGPVTFPEVRFRSLPWADIRAFGAVGDGSVDDTSAITDAIAAVKSRGGGTVLVPPGRFTFATSIVVPAGVDLWGCGGHNTGSVSSATVLQALHAHSQLVFRGRGGQSGNLVVDGSSITTAEKGLVYFDDCVERTIASLRAINSATDAVVIDRTQNCIFSDLQAGFAARDGLVLDFGAGGNIFIRSEVESCARDHVVIREAPGAGPPYNGKPTHNLFLHCILERPLGNPGINNSNLKVSGGTRNTFSNCVFAIGNPASGYIVHLVGGAYTAFDSCYFTSTSGGGIWNDSAGVVFSGLNRFNCPTAVRWDGTAWGRVLGRFEYDSPVDDRWIGTGNHRAFAAVLDRPTEIYLEPDAEYALRTRLRGENTHRFRLHSNGDVHMNGGSLAVQQITADPVPASSQAVLYVKAGKLVVAYKDGATVRYRWMQLSGASATWTHSTSPPE